jgi:acetyl-CoA carboxylase biotin carboxyl carrier protein
MTDNTSAMHIDIALVRQLAELLDETRLSEIEVQDEERKIRVARNLTHATAQFDNAISQSPVTLAPLAASVADAANPIAVGDLVKSPMVGTVYLAAEPGAKPFARVGDMVAEGATLVIIEAMKVMNPITAPRAGKIAEILVGNKQPVEYDQPLVVIA